MRGPATITTLLLLLAIGACTDEPEDVVRQTIGPAGGLVSSHDDVLTLVFQPGALTREYEIEIFPSEEPPLIFGSAYRVKPEIDLAVNLEVTYRRVLPNNTDGVTVGAIRLDDYTEQMGYWDALPRLSIDEASGSVLASDDQLSLYYGLLESGEGDAAIHVVGAVGAVDTEPDMASAPSDGLCGDDSQPGDRCFDDDDS